MQQEETIKPNAGFKMPEIVYDHESWGKKLLRAVLPKTWWVRILEGIVLLGLIAVFAEIFAFKGPSINGTPYILAIYYGIDCVFAFTRDVWATLSARRSEKRIVAALKQAEKEIQNNPLPVDTSNLDKYRK
jgi:hypothetical protein